MRRLCVTDVAVQDNINNGRYAKLFEIKKHCEVNNGTRLTFVLTQQGDRLYYTKYFLNFEYPSSRNGDIFINFSVIESNTEKIKLVYTEDTDRVIFYVKPLLTGRPVEMWAETETRLGNIKFIQLEKDDTDLSGVDIVLPTTNLAANTFDIPDSDKRCSFGSYYCSVGENPGEYQIAKIINSRTYSSSFFTFMITTAEGNNAEFTQTIVTIKHRVNEAGSFYSNIHYISGKSTGSSRVGSITIKTVKIDNQNCGIVLGFDKNNSGCMITPLSFYNSNYGRLYLEKPSLVTYTNDDYKASIKIDKTNVVITNSIDPQNDWNFTDSTREYFEQQICDNSVTITCYNLHAGIITDGVKIGGISSYLPSRNISVPVSSNKDTDIAARVVIDTTGNINIRGVSEGAIISFQMQYFI